MERVTYQEDNTMKILSATCHAPRSNAHPAWCMYSQPHEHDKMYNRARYLRYPAYDDHCGGTRQHYTIILPLDDRGDNKCWLGLVAGSRESMQAALDAWADDVLAELEVGHDDSVTRKIQCRAQSREGVATLTAWQDGGRVTGNIAYPNELL
jgi:hypothetical protein